MGAPIEGHARLQYLALVDQVGALEDEIHVHAIDRDLAQRVWNAVFNNIGGFRNQIQGQDIQDDQNLYERANALYQIVRPELDRLRQPILAGFRREMNILRENRQQLNEALAEFPEGNLLRAHFSANVNDMNTRIDEMLRNQQLMEQLIQIEMLDQGEERVNLINQMNLIAEDSTRHIQEEAAVEEELLAVERNPEEANQEEVAQAEVPEEPENPDDLSPVESDSDQDLDSDLEDPRVG